MTQRNHFLKIEQLRDSDTFVVFHQSKIVLRDEEIVWSSEQLTPHLLGNENLVLLEQGTESAIIAVDVEQEFSDQHDVESLSLWSLLRTDIDISLFGIAGKASQVLDWYKSHRYCGKCGESTVHHASERAVVCKACNHHYFPRINPCAIMLVVKGDKLLLARTSRIKSQFFSCLAGFIEVGETPEETVSREVMEEVGLEVENIRYISSQSWPFPSQLMLGFIADYKGGEITPEPAEIAEANWYDIDELQTITIPSADISVAGELIQHFVAQVKQRRSASS